MLQRGQSVPILPVQNAINLSDSAAESPRYTPPPLTLNIRTSRYEEDFDEVEKVGKGGYGSVYKVQNRLDGEYYALKKIPFKNTTPIFLDKVLREVKTLASLNHRNIVRYHSAWLETDTISTSNPSSLSSSSNKIEQPNNFLAPPPTNKGAAFIDGNWGTSSSYDSNTIQIDVKKKQNKTKINKKKKQSRYNNKNDDLDDDDEYDSLNKLQFPPELEEELKELGKQQSLRESMYITNINNNNEDTDDSCLSGSGSTGFGFFKTPKKHYTSFSLDDDENDNSCSGTVGGGGIDQRLQHPFDEDEQHSSDDDHSASLSSSSSYSSESDNDLQDDDDDDDDDSKQESDQDDDGESEQEDDDIFDDIKDLLPNPKKPITSSTTPPITMPSPRNYSKNYQQNNQQNNQQKPQQQSIRNSNSYKKQSPPNSKGVYKITTLYIVMQLYSQTLSQWLENRVPDQINEEENLNIFKQICIGLRYIHSKGIIHRDLKPGNVFLVRSSDQHHSNAFSAEYSSSLEENSELGELLVSLGDFGLAVQHISSTSPTPSPTPSSTPSLTPVNSGQIILSSISPLDSSTNSTISNYSTSTNNTNNLNNSSNCNNIINTTTTNTTTPSNPSSVATTPSISSVSTSLSRSLEHCKHTSAVGTLTYSSPEQKKGLYNEKTDIYSLGIILFELYYPFSTRMEKARVLTDLRNGVLPKQFLQKYPKVSHWILFMMKLNPDERPSASDILKSEIFGQILSVNEMESIIKQQQFLIEQLKQEIYQLKSPSNMSSTTAGFLPSPSPSLFSQLSAQIPPLINVDSSNNSSGSNSISGNNNNPNVVVSSTNSTPITAGPYI
ncbi:hypothetical protein CYY_008741 [Polysphondylium violaceum]|uniref:Protein kinase domain-containing protein n=1 Tax=Polysphondylium violaceum TaxID=133409 RepID=A0A8J4V3M7_9MYCE|nr:hypothetical protein CYY_008741 [Polysphondylium violaceum]